MSNRTEAIRNCVTDLAEAGNVEAIKDCRVGWMETRHNLMAERVLAAVYASDPAAEVRSVVARTLAEFRAEDAEFERAMELAFKARRLAGVR